MDEVSGLGCAGYIEVATLPAAAEQFAAANQLAEKWLPTAGRGG
jgi:hypothetical protein